MLPFRGSKNPACSGCQASCPCSRDQFPIFQAFTVQTSLKEDLEKGTLRAQLRVCRNARAPRSGGDGLRVSAPDSSSALHLVGTGRKGPSSSRSPRPDAGAQHGWSPVQCLHSCSNPVSWKEGTSCSTLQVIQRWGQQLFWG